MSERVQLPSAAHVLQQAYRLVGSAHGTAHQDAIAEAQVLLGIARELREGSQGPKVVVTDDVDAARAAFGARPDAWNDPGATQYLGPVTVDASSYGDQAAGETVVPHIEQAMPVPNDRGSIQELVRHDLLQRERVGVQRYGTPLQAFNGRSALRDLYEELLDAACYARQMIAEQEAQ